MENSPAPAGGLTRRVVRGGIWNTAANAGERLLGLVRTVCLARLLLPDDIGLMHLALSVVGGLHSFATTGLQPALIQRREVDPAVLNTAWAASILRGLLLGAVLAVSAPFVAVFFKQPQVTPILRLLALSQIFEGLRNVGFVLFQKELDFRSRARFDLLSGFWTTAVSVAAAFLLRNVWALVIGEMAGSVIRLYLSYRIHPYRPKLRWDSSIARELFNFGKHIFLFRIIDYFLLSGDDLLVGRMLGSEALGLYAYAYLLSNLPATAISRSVTGVILPAYAKLQDEPDALRTAYLRTIRFVAALSIPSGTIMLVFAPHITRTVLGETWLPMVPALRVLCIFGVLRSLGYTCGPLFQSIGRPDQLKNLGFWQLVALAAVIYPCLAGYGIVGAALAVTFGIFVFDLLAMRQVGRLIGLGFPELMRALTGPGLAAGLAGILGYGLGRIADLNATLYFAAALALCGLAYLAAMSIVDRSLLRELLSLVRQAR